MVKEVFGNFSKKNPCILRKKVYELIKIFEGFGQIFNFLRLKFSYLANRFQRYIDMCWTLKFLISVFFL
jgi:hypothetical protein